MSYPRGIHSLMNTALKDLNYAFYVSLKSNIFWKINAAWNIYVTLFSLLLIG